MKKNKKLLVLGMVLTMMLVFAQPIYAGAQEHRLAVPQGNRYSTSGMVAKEIYSEAETVIIVRGDSIEGLPQIVDGLSASGLAGAVNAPVLLTPKNGLHKDTAAVIKELGAKKAIIVGGEQAIEKNVISALKELGLSTERIYVQEGNRFDTAAEVAKRVIRERNPDTAIIAGAYALVDSLTAGPLAYEQGYPILLVGNRLPEATENIIKNNNINNLIIVGGPATVSLEVEEKLRGLITGKVTRIAGDDVYGKDRFGTSLNFANNFFPNHAALTLVNGHSFVDAVGASILGMPIVYVNQDQLSTHAENLLALKTDFKAIGGPAVISDSVVVKAYEVLGTEMNKSHIGEITMNTTQYSQTLEEVVNIQSGEYLQVSGNTVNVRRGAGTNHGIITEVKKDELYKILGTGKDADGFTWYKIDIASLGKEEDSGWIYSGLIRGFTKPQTDLYGGGWKDAKREDVEYYVNPYNFNAEWSSEDMLVITVNNLNVREEPSTNHDVITRVNEGQEFKFINTATPGDGYTWYEINIESLNLAQKSGWVRGDFTRELEADEISIPTHFFQFLVLSGQSGARTEDLNNILQNKGILENTGHAFMEAGKLSNINEIYLVSHGLLESGNGTSALANGILVDEVAGIPVEPKVVYNVYGIGAFDRDPIGLGSEYAYTREWFTPEAAIVGGAQWVSNWYVNHSSYQQDTLYKMRWNPSSPGNHQYATDIGWAVKQTSRIRSLYEMSENYELRFDVPEYKQ